jgi:hypothetical protein
MGLLDALQDPTFRADVKKNARNLAQSASNTLAENVSMPVDAMAWILRKAGVPVPENPMLGGNHLRQMGLTAPVQSGPSALAGETLGLLAPLAATKQGAAAAAKGLLAMGDNLAAPATLNKQTGAIVWHGSPHKFDKFDASKIGTGEGAQAYGHGLYFAETPDVAKGYRDKLSGAGYFSDDGKYFMKNDSKGTFHSFDPKTNSDALINESEFYKNAPASLYKVDLPDEHIAKMLDWDKPLSQQSKEVQKALEPLGYKIDAQATAAHDDALLGALFGDTSAAVPKMPKNPMGADIARGKGIFDQPQDKVIAEKLRQAGIPGIRYLDGSSRGTGAGTSNFVVFPGNEGLLNILERNGQPINKLQGLLSP